MSSTRVEAPPRPETARPTDGRAATTAAPDVATAAHQAFWLLRIGFTVAPILFGVDKFFNCSVHWPDYLAGWINDIAAGVLVAVAPRIGAFVVAAWLAGIIVNLLTNQPPEYYDIALRDFGLMLGALTLTRLAWVFARKGLPIRDRAAGHRLRPRRAAL